MTINKRIEKLEKAAQKQTGVFVILYGDGNGGAYEQAYDSPDRGQYFGPDDLAALEQAGKTIILVNYIDHEEVTK